MNNNIVLRRLVALTPLLWLLLAAAPAHADGEPDWLLRYNRTMFEFNQQVDRAVLKPLARGYKAVTPEAVDQGISNFFSNLDDVIVIANDLLQLKFDQALQDSNRLLINSTFGMLGLFDVASDLGLPKHDEDFGQTLGYWGVGEGYYLVLPLLGSTTTRDIWSLPVDALVNPVNYVDPAGARYGMRALELVDFRGDLLSLERAFGDSVIDPYTFHRDAYLQRRRSLVADLDLGVSPTPGGGAGPGADPDADALFDQLQRDAAPTPPGADGDVDGDALFEELETLQQDATE